MRGDLCPVVGQNRLKKKSIVTSLYLSPGPCLSSCAASASGSARRGGGGAATWSASGAAGTSATDCGGTRYINTLASCYYCVNEVKVLWCWKGTSDSRFFYFICRPFWYNSCDCVSVFICVL